MTIHDVIRVIEEFAPASLQESYDNAGLIIGDANKDATGVLCCLDVTEAVIEEALKLKVNLIVSHHPVIFSGLKSITGKNYVERIIIQAIQHNIALFSAHTNLDNTFDGVNKTIAEKLGLQNLTILAPMKNQILKLITYVPNDQAEQVRSSIFAAGAGNIGNYDSCSYNLEGKGSFRGNENTKPYVGEKGIIHFENETRIETVVLRHNLKKVLKALFKSHPYEEVAYDLYALENENSNMGAGISGTLPEPLEVKDFLDFLRTSFNIPAIKYAGKQTHKIQKIAVCGGSGSFLLEKAISSGTDAFITGDVKYHQFFDAEDKILYCDIGHFESEQFTREIFYTLLTKKLSKFAVHLSEVVTNPVKYHV